MLQLSDSPPANSFASIDESYELCRRVTAECSKTFYLGTLLMAPEKRRAIWAIYVWCRRTDELVDGPQSQKTNESTLDRWEAHLESIFAGHPVDDMDIAMVDTLERFPLDMQPFRDMIAGQRMDLHRSRYDTFKDLELYCYRVAGTVGLMSTTVMGVDQSQFSAPWCCQSEQKAPVEEAIALGIANQLTNILRDVGEDARRGRIYLPLEDLAKFDYTEEDLMQGVIDSRWQALMQFEIQRARQFYAAAEKGVGQLSDDARWPVWTALILYRKILEVIENNQYDVFNKRAFVSSLDKMRCLPGALLRARVS